MHSLGKTLLAFALLHSILQCQICLLPQVFLDLILLHSERSYPMPEVRDGGREEQPHVQGAVAARAQEGREELLHVQGQEERPVRRYPSFKVRETQVRR